MHPTSSLSGSVPLGPKLQANNQREDRQAGYKQSFVNMPDLNSLPPSRSPSGTQLRANGNPPESRPGELGSHSPRASSVSLAAAATINAGIHQESRRSSTSSNRNRPSQSSSRRRSNVAMNLSLNDPTLPSPGELQSPEQPSSMGQAFRTSSPRRQYSPPWLQHHHRTPSLGELHQELEQESEAQVVCYPTTD